MPYDGIIYKIALRDVDLLFEGRKFQTLIHQNRLELAKNASNGFNIFRYFSTNDTIAKVVSHDIYLLFQSKKCEVFISRSAKCDMTLVSGVLTFLFFKM